jgi:pantetheine-phosphate adenylyltransferase
MTEPKKAIYAGSFDPITNGHIDIIRRALRIFDYITIGVIENPDKTPLFSIEERISLIESVFPVHDRLTIAGFSGLLVEFAKAQSISTIVRGLRAVSDFDYEFQMALTNRRLLPNVDTVFLMTDHLYSHLSSSLVRQVARFGGDVSPFVPGSVQKALTEKYTNE